jgi:CheY-like chemotaxis protein
MLGLNRHSGRGTDTPPLRVLVAAPQPLHRELIRFFLEEEGCQVVALVASGEDAVSLGTSKRPDAVILHESLADSSGAGLVQRVRQGSTSTKIVVVTPQPERAWCGPSRGADAFLEEWVGIQELGIVLHRLCPGTSVPAQLTRMQPEPGTGSASKGQRRLPLPHRVVNLPVGRRARWHERFSGAAVASVILLLLLGRGLFPEPATSEGPGSAASAHLMNAYLTLDVLVTSMRGGKSEEAMAQTARRLLVERAAALASGADTARLDAAIDADVSPLLSTVADEGAAAVEYVLGELVSYPGSAAQPPDWPGAGAGSKGHPNGVVHPQAVAQPGGIGDSPGGAEPGAQGDSSQGAQGDSSQGAQGDSSQGAQGDSSQGAQGDYSQGAQGDSSQGAQGDKGSKTKAQPDGDAESGSRPHGQAEHTRPESGPSHPDHSTPHVPESAPPVPGGGLGPEVILTPVGRGRPELDG